MRRRPRNALRTFRATPAAGADVIDGQGLASGGGPADPLLAVLAMGRNIGGRSP